MNKAIVTVGFTNYVLDIEQAVRLAELLAQAEIYEEKYRKTEEGGSTYHIYEQVHKDNMVTMKVVPKTFYNMAKMAGKPVA